MGSAASKRKARNQFWSAALQKNQPPQGVLTSLYRKPWILAVVLALLTLVIYLAVHHHPFFAISRLGSHISAA